MPLNTQQPSHLYNSRSYYNVPYNMNAALQEVHKFINATVIVQSARS